MSEKNEDRVSEWESLGKYVEALTAEHGIPGIAVGLIHEGEVFSAGFGVTNVDHPLPVTAETLFQIGSISKTYCGTAIMRLVEKGQIELDAPVRRYLPEFMVADEAAAVKVTIRDLLTHSAGWEGDFFYDPGAGDNALKLYVEGMADLEQMAEVGRYFSYNNAGFAVIGRIIEVVTGQSFAEAVHDLVFQPLDLGRSFLDAGDMMTYRFAVGHVEGEGGAEVARPWPLPDAVKPMGGIICDVQDLLRYAQFHLGDGSTPSGEAVLSTESMQQMRAPHLTVWENEYRGLSWAVDDTGGERLVTHSGGTLGQVSMLILVPERNFACVVLTNHERGGVATQAISRRLLKEYLGVEIKDPPPIESALEELAAFSGFYSRPFADIELRMLAGQLVGQMVDKEGFPDKDMTPDPPGLPVSLVLCGKDRLLINAGPWKGTTAEIIRKDDGSIGWLRVFGRLHVRQG